MAGRMFLDDVGKLFGRHERVIFSTFVVGYSKLRKALLCEQCNGEIDHLSERAARSHWKLIGMR